MADGTVFGAKTNKLHRREYNGESIGRCIKHVYLIVDANAGQNRRATRSMSCTSNKSSVSDVSTIAPSVKSHVTSVASETGHRHSDDFVSDSPLDDTSDNSELIYN